MSDTPTHIRISNGRLVNLENFGPEDIDLLSISRSLNTIRRFTGHWETKPPLTVAQHTLLCMELAARIFPGEEDVEFMCLIHDFGEAYYGDLSSPLKNVLKSFKPTVKNIDETINSTLWPSRMGELTEDIVGKEKYCDRLALTIERDNMWKPKKDDHDPNFFPQLDILEEFRQGEELSVMLFDHFQNIPFLDLAGVYNSFGMDEKESA